MQPIRGFGSGQIGMEKLNLKSRYNSKKEEEEKEETEFMQLTPTQLGQGFDDDATYSYNFLAQLIIFWKIV